jgi:Fe(3+) dicitrate transport protein
MCRCYIRLIFLCLLLATLHVSTARAQATGSVAGAIVAAETGEPIAGALVRLVEQGREASSDRSGRFRIDEIPPGTHTLEATALGRRVARRRITVPAQGMAAADLALEPTTVEAPAIRVVLDPRRIVGSDAAATMIPGAAHFIGLTDLERQRLLYDDAHRVLRQVPGVNLQEEDGYGLRPNIGLRGTGSERSSKITLMEDGILIAPAPYAAPAAYYFPVIGRMEAVEVRKGASQVKYGPRTIGGAINLVSSSIPEELGVLADVQGGGDATGKAHLRLGDDYAYLGWLAETYQITTDGFKRLEEGGDTGFEIQDYLFKLAVHTRPEAAIYQELELKFGHYDETSDETYLGLTEKDFRASPLRRYAASQKDVMRAEHDQIQLRWTLRPSEKLELTTALYNNDFHRNWYKLDQVLGRAIADVLERPEDFPKEMAILRGAASEEGALKLRANNRTYYARGVQATLGLRVGETMRHGIELGVRYHEDREDRFQHDDDYRMETGRMVLTRAGAPGSQSNRVSDARAWAFYLQDQILVGRWTLTPGLRYETIKFTRTEYSTTDPNRVSRTAGVENAVDVVIPGIGASYALDDGVNVFAGIHRGFGPPGPGAARETRPEESVNYELGIKLVRPWVDLQAVGFYSDYDNILGKATLAVGDPDGAGDLFNGGAVRVAGIELGLELDPAVALRFDYRLPIRVAYTLTRAEFLSSFESEFEPWGTVEAGDELPYLSEHQLYAEMGVARGRWAGRLAAHQTSAMRTRAGRGPIPQGSATDAFTVWSVSAEFAVTSWSTLFAGVENLTDEVYVVARRPAGARPGLPRTLSAGVRLGH